MSMLNRGKLKWWVIIRSDSWLTKAHGAFSLGFLARNGNISKDDNAVMHCQKC
jgi:hypothetical protein